MVVAREKVAVLTQGTLTDSEMLAEQPEASYLMALAELPVPGARVVEGVEGRASVQWAVRQCRRNVYGGVLGGLAAQEK